MSCGLCIRPGAPHLPGLRGPLGSRGSPPDIHPGYARLGSMLSAFCPSGRPPPRPPRPWDPLGPGVVSLRPPRLHSSGECAVGLTSGWVGLPRASLWRASLHISLVSSCGWTQGLWVEPARRWVPSPFLCPGVGETASFIDCKQARGQGHGLGSSERRCWTIFPAFSAGLWHPCLVSGTAASVGETRGPHRFM